MHTPHCFARGINNNALHCDAFFSAGALHLGIFRMGHVIRPRPLEKESVSGGSVSDFAASASRTPRINAQGWQFGKAIVELPKASSASVPVALV